jgi:Cd2+/Zn2+-exporting ATPase
MKDDLNKVTEAVHLGGHTLRIIQTKIISALAIKALFLALALFGYTSLCLAILADTGATLWVILILYKLLRSSGHSLNSRATMRASRSHKGIAD